MIAEPVGHRALDRHDVPSRIVGSVGAAQHLLGLCQLACVGQRLAVFAKNVEILRGLDRRRLNDRDGLIVARQGAEGARVFDRGHLLARVALVAPPAIIGIGAKLRFITRERRGAVDRTRDVAEIVAPAKRRRAAREGQDPKHAPSESQAAGLSIMRHSRASRREPVGANLGRGACSKLPRGFDDREELLKQVAAGSSKREFAKPFGPLAGSAYRPTQARRILGLGRQRPIRPDRDLTLARKVFRLNSPALRL